MPSKITEHFTWAEFTRSQTASRQGITNNPSGRQRQVIEGLVVNCLEPARQALGPIQVSSGYRCPLLNAKVGGAEKSDHQVLERSAAADLVHGGLGRLFRWLAVFTPWSRLIWEFGSWVHVSWSEVPVPGRTPLVATRKQTGGVHYDHVTWDTIRTLGE